MIDNRRSSTEFLSHFWTPDDPRYLNYDWSFDVANDALVLMPANAIAPSNSPSAILQLNSFLAAVVDSLLVIEAFAQWAAERNGGADSFHAKEELRHASALAKYREVRWPPSSCQAPLLLQSINTVIAHETPAFVTSLAREVGESIALTLTGFLHSRSADPLLVRLCSFVIADELAHECDDDELHDDINSGSQAERMKFGKCASQIFKALREDCISAFEWRDDAKASETLLEYAPDIATRLTTLGIPRRSLSPFIRSMGQRWSKTRPLLEHIADDATCFLSRISKDRNPMPPPALAIEWLVAGLRSINGIYS